MQPQQLAQLLTMSGIQLASMEKKGQDYMLDVEVTANRADCFSILGLAREVAALTGKKLKIPAVKVRTVKHDDDPHLEVRVQDKDLCPRYSVRLIRDVAVGPIDKYFTDRLATLDARSVNNIVDITNFCLFELGQPMHAFDYDKIKNGVLVVRRSKKGEKIVTIDGVERTLEDGMLVIADQTRPIAIAGIMGGIDTEVTRSTKNIILESAYFDQVSIRRTSRKLGLCTESSYRFERNVDPDNIVPASDRASVLVSEFASGKISKLIDIGAKKISRKKVPIRIRRLNSILGCNISVSNTKKILQGLGIKTKSAGKDDFICDIPTYRPDLEREIDLIEEISRIYGYDNVPRTLPSLVEQSGRYDEGWLARSRAREVLTSVGFDEIITYSLLSRALLNNVSPDLNNVVSVKNPLSSEQEIMRPTLLAGMLLAVSRNLNRKTMDLKVFELANIYLKYGPRKFKENLNMCISVTGPRYGNWQDGKKVSDFFDLKGAVESLLLGLGAADYEFIIKDHPYFLRGRSSALLVLGDEVGILGGINKEMLGRFDIKQDVYAAEIDFAKLLGHVKLQKRFLSLPTVPSVRRDISLVVDEAVAHHDISEAIRQTGGEIIRDIELLDLYKGEQIPAGKKSLLYSVEYFNPRKTLTDKEVDAVHDKVRAAIKERFSAQLR